MFKIKSLVISTIAIIVILILIIIAINKRFTSIKNEELAYTHYIVYDLELEAEMWELKSELIDEVQNYISTNAPASDLSAIVVINECLKYDVSLPFVLAQGMKESHFGMYGMASKTNSVWNVGAYDDLKVNQINKKHIFPHPNESVRPYLKLLKNRYLVNKTEQDLMTKYVDINGARYASYPKYEEELKLLYNSILNNTGINEKYIQLQNYLKKLNY